MGADTRSSKSAVSPRTQTLARPKVLCPRERKSAVSPGTPCPKERPGTPLSLFVNTPSKSAGRGETLHSVAVFC